MNLTRRECFKCGRGGARIGLLFALFALFAVTARAEVHDIEATFQPDSSNPQKNQFKNQTPSEGFCQQVPQACEPSGLFSLIARIPFTANAPIRANHADPRQGGMAKVASDWRDVTVNHASGEPQGGWQFWLTQGRKPTRLFRDQTFNISASSRFKMNLRCQYASGNNCALLEPAAGHPVPLEVSVTLPAGLTDAAGQPVNRRPLRRDGIGTELFQPGFYLDRKPGTLHFEVAREAVPEMLKPGVSRSYSGNVTVIWDSEAG